MTKNTSDSLENQIDNVQIHNENSCQEFDCQCHCDKLPSDSTTLSLTSSLTSSTTQSNSRRENDKTEHKEHILIQASPINRPRSCPSFAHCANSENGNISLDENCDKFDNTTERAFVCSYKNPCLGLRGLRGQRDDNNLIPHNDNFINSHLNARRIGRVGHCTENCSIVPCELIPSSPLWTSLAMKERIVSTSVSKGGDNKNCQIRGVNKVKECESTGNEESRSEIQRVTDNRKGAKLTSPNLSPSSVPVRSSLFQEFHLNMKIGDEPVRFHLPGDFSVNCVNSDFETGINNNGGTSCQYEKQLNIYTAIGKFLKVKGFFRKDNDTICHSTPCDEGLADNMLDEETDCEIMSQDNEESSECSTDEECTDFDTSLADSRRQSIRPGNPVARVLEFGGSEHLIPILKDDLERPSSNTKEK